MACNCYNPGDVLSVPRGTTAAFALTVINRDTGQPYTLEHGETLVFAVSNNRNDPVGSRVIKKKITDVVDGTYYLELTPEDTANLPVGSNYWYSIGLQSGSDVLYPILGQDWSPFAITPYAVKLGDGQ